MADYLSVLSGQRIRRGIDKRRTRRGRRRVSAASEQSAGRGREDEKVRGGIFMILLIINIVSLFLLAELCLNEN